MNLSDLVARNAAFTPAKTALRFRDTAISYRQLAQRIEATFSVLQAGLRIAPGERVALLATNHPDYLVLLYACARLGAILVPLNWRLAVPELQFMLDDSDAKLLVLGQDFAGTPLARPGMAVIDLAALDRRIADADSAAGPPACGDYSSPLLLVYTSGTTGRPKGAVLAQQALLANGIMSHHAHAMTSDDHILTVLPFFHVGGLNIQTTPALHIGATVTIHARFDATALLAAIAHDRPTLLLTVPAVLQAMLAHPAWLQTDLSSLRAISTGSTIVPPALIDAVSARRVPVLQIYGATETGPTAIYTRLGGDLSRAGSTGLAGLLCEARVIDENATEVPDGTPGEILIRGPNVLTEYWRNPAATSAALANGWFRTGDIGTRDPDGYYVIHDRLKNMFISGGENVYPAEIERVLLTHPAVAECAVIGVADPKWQEVPRAFVILRPGVAGTADDLQAHVRAQLARFKVPQKIDFVDDLPRTALGKVQHFRLR
jgi:fatty-acyl-CoA synthase